MSATPPYPFVHIHQKRTFFFGSFAYQTHIRFHLTNSFHSIIITTKEQFPASKGEKRSAYKICIDLYFFAAGGNRGLPHVQFMYVYFKEEKKCFIR